VLRALTEVEPVQQHSVRNTLILRVALKAIMFTTAHDNFGEAILDGGC